LTCLARPRLIAYRHFR